MGFGIDEYTFEGAVKRALELSDGAGVSQVVTINPEMIEYGLKNCEFAEIVNSAEIVIPDGVGVKLALRLNGVNVERIAGIDFAMRLLERCAEEGKPVAIVGAKPEIVEKAVAKLRKDIVGLNIVYYRDGYFKDFESVYNELGTKRPKVVLVAMGSPIQEEFIYGAKSVLKSCIMVGIGGSLDVWSGNVKRAPKLCRKLGLEWLYRTVLQPERIKRIFPALPLFLLKALRFKYYHKHGKGGL